jgi:hypothetical protein
MRYRKLASFCCGALLATGAQAQRVDFATQIQPLLQAKCGACHGGDKRSGGFTVREYNEMLHGGRSGASIMPGNAKASLLIQRIDGSRGPTMPLGGAPLTAAEIATLSTWIGEGARLTPTAAQAKTPWIAPLALTVPALPDSPAKHPIDRFLPAGPPPIGDAAFARRAYLDVWGLLPSPEDLDRFVKDPAPDKREKLVDRLLADNRNYSEHWMSFWNDLLRNDGGDNYHGGRKSISDWLYRALETNEPYNRFVAELLNPTTPQSPEGFLLGVNWRGDVNASQTPTMQAAQNSAQIFLGINLKCNSCHDSFISKWKLKDAYALAAYFSQEPKLELVRCDNRTGVYASPSFLFPELNGAAVPESLADRHAAVAQLFTDPRNGRLPRTIVNRYWARLLGRGIVADVDDLDAEPWNPQLLDWLASDFVAHGYDLKRLIRTIMTSQAYQLPAVRRGSSEIKDYTFAGPEVRRITAEEFVDAIGTITGEWEVSGRNYTRDWRVQSTNLSRALGRPIRDQVFTERDCSSTTLQELELVNGETVTRLIGRGAQRLLGTLTPPPSNRFDSGRIGSNHVDVNVDISGLNELHLVVADAGSYSPERVLPVWADLQVEKDGAWVPLASEAPVQMKGAKYATALRAPVGSDRTFDLRGKGYTRLKATVGVEESCLQSDISASVRFFVFAEKPDWDHLEQVDPHTPLAPPIHLSDPAKLIDRVWMQALGRVPSPAEKRLALDAMKQPGGLADILWSLFLLPEFQLIG